MSLLGAEVLDGLLDASVRSQEVISNNLANLNTPGYRAGRVRFRRALDSALQQSDPEMLETEVYRPHFQDAGPDGNDVSLEREVLALNKNTARTRLYLALLGFRMRQTRAAIKGK